MANHMLGGGALRSRLADRIRQKEGLSYGVGSQLNIPARDPAGLWLAYAISAPQNTAKVEAALREEIDLAIKEGFTAAELAEAKKGWKQGEEVYRTEDGPLAGRLADYLTLDRTMAFDKDLEAKVAALTVAQVNEALRTNLKPAASRSSAPATSPSRASRPKRRSKRRLAAMQKGTACEGPSLFYVPARGGRLAAFCDVDLDAAVACTAAGVVVRRDWLALAAAFDGDAVRRDAALRQVVAGAGCAVDRQRLVDRLAADAVGVADDGHGGGRVFIQGLCEALQHWTEVRLDVRTAGVERHVGRDFQLQAVIRGLA